MVQEPDDTFRLSGTLADQSALSGVLDTDASSELDAAQADLQCTFASEDWRNFGNDAVLRARIMNGLRESILAINGFVS